MKQTFEIPKGCTRVTIEQHEDKVLTIFESKRFEEKDLLRYDTIVTNNSRGVCVEFKEEEPEVLFNDGDIIKIIATDGRFMIAVKKGSGRLSHINESYVLINYSKTLVIDDLFGFNPEVDDLVRFSPESLPIIQDALAKVGKKWNAEKKCIEELKPERWRAQEGSKYWFLNEALKAVCDIEDRYDVNNQRYNCGNYFQTEQQARDFAEQIKQLPR